MVRKPTEPAKKAVKKSAQKASNGVKKPSLLSLSDILGCKGLTQQASKGKELPPGFSLLNEVGEVIKTTPRKSKSVTKGDQTKVSPFKMVGIVAGKQTEAAKTWGELSLACKRGLVDWESVSFSKDVVKYLQKNMSLLRD